MSSNMKIMLVCAVLGTIFINLILGELLETPNFLLRCLCGALWGLHCAMVMTPSKDEG